MRLAVIVPATFNAVPNIGNPIYGWNGPTFGWTLQLAN